MNPREGRSVTDTIYVVQHYRQDENVNKPTGGRRNLITCRLMYIITLLKYSRYLHFVCYVREEDRFILFYLLNYIDIQED